MRKTAPIWGGLLFVGGLGNLGDFEGERNDKSAEKDNFYLSIL